MRNPDGKLRQKDEMIAYLWKWLPWSCFLLVFLPAPIVFSILLLTASVPDSIAFYLALAVLSLPISGLIALSCVLLLLVFRRRWYSSLRDRLAQDGITADEVTWFASELTSGERKALAEISHQNPPLADAYCETLASRLTASRIISKVRRERLSVERRLNQARFLSGTETASLLGDLQKDYQQLETLRKEATSRLAKAKARLQVIEAAASRSLNQTETNLMLRRLVESQNQIPLAMELARLEQEAHEETEDALNSSSHSEPNSAQ